MGGVFSRPARMTQQGTPAFGRRIAPESVVPANGRAVSPRSKSSRGSSGTSRVSDTVQQGWRSPGSPLRPDLRQRLEQRFGDLSHVRVHAGGEAAVAAEAAGAAAFTWKNHVVFGGHRYQPDTPAGQALLTHEIVHVAQQRNARTADGEARLSGRDHPLERNAFRGFSQDDRGEPECSPNTSPSHQHF